MGVRAPDARFPEMRQGKRIAAKAGVEAKAIELKGQATAQAIKAQAVALSKNPNVVDRHKADRWDAKLPTAMYSNAPLPFFNLGSTQAAAKP